MLFGELNGISDTMGMGRSETSVPCFFPYQRVRQAIKSFEINYDQDKLAISHPQKPLLLS